MNASWIKVVLIISLGLNCLIAGALGYRYFWGRPFDRMFSGTLPDRPRAFDVLPQKNLAAHDELRKQMFAGRRDIAAAKDSLLDLLAAPVPDHRLIEEQLGLINSRQARMERMVMEQMLQDIQSLPPDKRTDFIQDIRQSMYCRRGDGPGMGRGGRGGRHGSKHFQP